MVSVVEIDNIKNINTSSKNLKDWVNLNEVLPQTESNESDYNAAISSEEGHMNEVANDGRQAINPAIPMLTKDQRKNIRGNVREMRAAKNA